MLNKRTFLTDKELNLFFDTFTKNGESTIYIVKLIILHNPAKNRQEFHLIYSDHFTMKAGQHLRKGCQ